MFRDPADLAIAAGAALTFAVIIQSLLRERRWYKKQRRLMEFDRPPLPDAAYLAAVPIAQGEETLWLAVRRAVAESIGLACEAIYPEDRLADLWRMQWLGPDLMDIIFRLERIVGIKIRREWLDDSFSLRYGQPGVFLEFAEFMVRSIPRVTLKPQAKA
ncbi:MAG: hypothetical protein U0790_25390 [Isosphaeraceae bacterium]